jgi:hypothetical protein
LLFAVCFVIGAAQHRELLWWLSATAGANDICVEQRASVREGRSTNPDVIAVALSRAAG